MTESTPKPHSPWRRKLLTGLGLLSLLYLLNPTAGIFELIPDNLPLIGNLDEAAATTFILAALREYGWDLTHWFRRKP